MRGGYAVAVLSAGLLLAGCGAAGQSRAAAPLPAPSRELIGWAQTVCTNTSAVDSLRAKIDEVNKEAADPALGGATASSYLTDMDTSIGQPIQGLKTLAPVGVSAADGYVRDLLGKLSAVRTQLPAQSAVSALSDAQKIAKARQFAAVVAAIPVGQPKLTGVITNSPKLISSYNLAPGCTPVTASGAPRPGPNRSAIGWADTMCTNEQSVAGLGASPLVPAGGNEALAAVSIAGYISSASGQVNTIAQAIRPLSNIGIKEADDYRTRLLNSINSALAKLPQQTGMQDAMNMSADELQKQANQVHDILAGLKGGGSGLSAIAAHNPRFGAIYRLAPACQPPTSATAVTARNGTDIGACRGGQCQVQVSKKVTITAGGITFSAEVQGATVSFVDDSGVSSTGASGSVSFGKAGGKTVDIHVADVRSGTAILDISVS